MSDAGSDKPKRGRGGGGGGGGGGGRGGGKRAGRGGRGGGGAPAKGSHLDAVSPDMALLIQKEDALQKELSGVRRSLAMRRSSRDAQYSQALPVRQEMHEKLEEISERMDAKRAEKESIYSELRSTGAGGIRQRATRDRLTDHLEILKLEIEPVREDIRRLRRERKALIGKVEQGGKDAGAAQRKQQFVSLAQLDSEKRHAEAALESARRQGHSTVERDLTVKLAKMEKERLKMDSLSRLADGVCTDRLRVVEIDDLLESRLDAFKNLDEKIAAMKAERDMCGKALDESRETGSKQVKELKSRLDAVKDELADLQKERRSVLERGRVKRDEKEDDAIKALAEKRDKLAGEIAEVRSKIPTRTIDFDTEFTSDLVGAGGATVRELETDYSCTIAIREMEKKVVVRGGQVDECAAAVAELLAAAAAARHEVVIGYDPATTGQLLQGQVPQVQRMRKQSGAKIRIQSKEGKIIVTGKEDQVTLAEALVKEFIESNTRDEITFRETQCALLRGKYLRRLQEETGCRTVRLNSDTGVVAFSGRAECVADAKARIESFVQKMSEGSYSRKLPAGVSERAVIGRYAENARAIEEQTGALVTIGAEHVSLAGTEESVASAKKLLEALLQDLYREEITVAYPILLHHLLVRPGDAVGEREEEEEGSPARGKRKRAPRRAPCFLEEVRRSTGCDSVMAQRDKEKSKAHVLIVGRRDQAVKARDKIELFLAEHRLCSVELECPPAVSRFMMRGRRSIIHEARSVAGVEEVRVDGDLLEIHGSKDGVVEAKACLAQHIKDLTSGMDVLEFERETAGLLIGKGGSVIREVEQQHGACVHLDKVRGLAFIAAADPASVQAAKAMMADLYSENKQRAEEDDRGKGRGKGKGKGKGKGGKGDGRASEKVPREQQKFKGWTAEEFPAVGGEKAAQPLVMCGKTERPPPPPAIILEKRHDPVERIVDPEWQRLKREREQREQRERRGKGESSRKGGKGDREDRKGGKGDRRAKGGEDSSERALGEGKNAARRV